MVPNRYSHIVLIIELKVSHVMSQKQRKGSVGVRSERCRLLGGNLLTSLSTALEVFPYRKVYVLKDDKLRAEIIRLYHDTPVRGHGRLWKTVELVTRNF